MRKSKKFFALTLVAIMMIVSSTSVVFAVDGNPVKEVKNVIILIPDGTSMGGTTLARWYNGGEPFALDEFACGLSRPYSADAPIADSAPGGSALATGYKSHTGFIATLPDENTMPGLEALKEGEQRKPVATVLEAAKLSGKATGIISTSELMHATPASFSSHDPSRKAYDNLSEQQVYNGMDVVLGGGYKFLQAENRADNEDMIQVVKDLGYDYITTAKEMEAASSNKLWGMFAPAALDNDFDRKPEEQPSLAQMTQKAIDVLSQDEDGFFLMVEGSKVDWASHANEPVGLISEILAFNDAAKVALDFSKENKDTVVISVTDHGNGGVTIGNSNLDSGYDKEPLASFIEPLKKAKLTGEAVVEKFNDDRSNVREVMAEYYGVTDLTEEEVAWIQTTDDRLTNVIGPMISQRANVGWTTHGHTGEDVVVYIYAPNGDRPTGLMENTDIAKYMARILGVDLDATNQRLFVPVRSAFEAKGATVVWDDSDVNNPEVVVTKGDDTLRLPVNKNIANLNGEVVELPGVTVWNGLTTYASQDAIDLIK